MQYSYWARTSGCSYAGQSSDIDHFHNGDQFKYSFMCILITHLGLIQMQVFYSIADTETSARKIIKMHINEYLNRLSL